MDKDRRIAELECLVVDLKRTIDEMMSNECQIVSREEALNGIFSNNNDDFIVVDTDGGGLQVCYLCDCDVNYLKECELIYIRKRNSNDR